ncbi:MAG: N-6 DNA methylase [Blastocatellia bacterium]
MAEARDERHRYGQHYTPLEVARLLVAFAIRSGDDLVFDPSCGDGRLLAEALKRKHQLSKSPNRPGRFREVFGSDRSVRAIRLAAATGAQIAVGDFFNIGPGASLSRSVILPQAFDAIIGNPPYIRQELMRARDKRRIQKRIELDRLASPDILWPQWSGRSDIYVYFFAHAIRFLRPGGRLVFLTASSWLDAGYGAALREFLLSNFRVIAVLESGCESFFEDASINTAITVLARDPEPAGRQANHIRFVELKRPLAEILDCKATDQGGSVWPPVRFANLIERSLASAAFDTHRIRIIKQADLGERAASGSGFTVQSSGLNQEPGTRNPEPGTTFPGWGKFVRAEDVFFRVLERGSENLRSLSDLARVRFGVKTGANEFFYVSGQGLKNSGNSANGKEARANSEAQYERGGRGLRALADVAVVRRGLTTGANEFFYLSLQPSKTLTTSDAHRATGIGEPLHVSGIESRFLSPVIFSLKEIPGIVLEAEHATRFFFNCPASREELAGTHALDHIRRGEQAGLHLRPTCSSRDPWYSVARGMKPAPIIFPSKVGERWVVALNRAGVFEDKKLYGIFPAEGVSELTLAALLNSTWARYYAEITCRQMTGAQAIADIDVAVAEQIRIPNARQLSSSIQKRLEAAVLALSLRPVYSVFEEVNRSDRQRLDMMTLEAIGFSDESERQAVLNEMYQAVTELVRRRLEKSKR